MFIMPDADVVLEPVWEAAESAPEADDSEKKSSDKKSSEKSGVTVFTKKESKDYINIRSTYGYDGEVVTKVSDNSTELEYSGKSESIYDEDDLKTYTWYYVSIPSKDKEGWVRSDMLSGGESDADDKDGDSYVKSEEYDSVALRESADADAEVRAEVEDDETELIFTGKTKESEDKNGKTTVWYYVKDSSTGSSGWVEKSKLRHVS